MNALLVMVHGSPRPESNIDMYAVVEEVRKTGRYPIVEVGFMECNEPPIPEAIDRCVTAGATRIVAMPYFLHTGNHVTDDLPTLLGDGQERHPGVTIVMSDYLGHDALIADVVTDRVHEARQVALQTQ
ncbi:MAG: hypothetical protein NVS2B7_24940 [Herpetosiphon sp.]